ncbi:tetraacyldisaccharide 4'-kinase [uncultured Pseudodesulfovibrio sp.]|uniref:tetraacyldisaccharide 4'-kinase n=1 Tax=uncultured Pseudodesulfovibrio sp. TaxID=2035858 RepID=UPI0029C64003|nr:tetraacyldisaccharide 4'-kinase [uncultured Pseudodesulfovibrio sp.]
MTDITTIQNSLAPILKPLSWVYGAGMCMRDSLYRRGLIRSWEPEALTVSVGNIGWGGSGKTPVAGWLLDWAEKNNIEALLLTRGYKAKPVSYPYLVKPGALPEEAGDEPLMLATEHRKAHVVVDPDRTRGGKWAMKKFHPRLVILDDGFQHMAVKRHFNLVLLRIEDLDSQWNRVIPSGSWREPPSALNRADAFMIKASPNAFKKLGPYLTERLGKFRKPVFSFQIRPTSVQHVLTQERRPDLGGARYLLVSGVGSPKQVQHTTQKYFGYPPAKHLVYPDHHSYTKNDVLDLQAAARNLECEAIVCTPKDAVKLGPMCTEEFWQLNLRTDFGPSTIGQDSPFDAWWGRRFETFDRRRREGLQAAAEEAMQDDTPSNG